MKSKQSGIRKFAHGITRAVLGSLWLLAPRYEDQASVAASVPQQVPVALRADAAGAGMSEMGAEQMDTESEVNPHELKTAVKARLASFTTLPVGRPDVPIANGNRVVGGTGASDSINQADQAWFFSSIHPAFASSIII